jgi:hypothetical protein
MPIWRLVQFSKLFHVVADTISEKDSILLPLQQCPEGQGWSTEVTERGACVFFLVWFLHFPPVGGMPVKELQVACNWLFSWRSGDGPGHWVHQNKKLLHQMTVMIK